VNKFKPAALAALALAVFLVMAGPAAARSRDRNHDGIPDRWEVTNHLSLHVNQARRDQDHDGLKNRAEFKAGDNPRKADSDNDGIKDGAEHAGTIASFTNGVLTINLFGGGSIAGQVTDATELKCESTATASSDGDGGNSGPGGGDDKSGSGGSGSGSGDDQSGSTQSDDPAGHDQGDDDTNEQGDDNDDDQGDDNGGQAGDQSCGTDQLTAGREVDEAELNLSNGTATFKEVKLAPPAA
jgi:hypothetical protein